VAVVTRARPAPRAGRVPGTRPAVERGWAPWLAAIAVALPAAAPLFGPGLIGTHRYGDSPFLLTRLVAVVDALRQGTLFPRWSPELAYGLGYPLFDFYGALAFYAAALLHVAGVPAVEALKATQVGGFVLGSVAMFALARRHLGDLGGLVAAAAYACAPYHLVNVYARGDSLGEFAALALLPAVLLALEVAADGRLGGALAAGLLAAALVWTHNLSALLALPTIALWALWALVRAARSSRAALFRAAALLGLAGALGLGLGAFYWLPVLMDRRYVHFEFNTTGYFDFRGHFLSLARLVQASPIYDYGLDGTPDGHLPFQLGLVQAVVAVAGLLLAAIIGRRLGALAGVSAALGLGYAALATPLARAAWEALPPLQIAQFPWRALGPASLGLALLAALPVPVLGGRWRAGYAGVVVAAVVGSAVLGANPDRWRIAPDEVNAAGVQQYEYLTSSIGSTVRYEYLPLAAQERPWTSGYVTLGDDAPLRALPGQPVQVDAVERLGMGFVLDLTARESRPVVFEQHWFPGWSARVDGAEAAIWPSQPDGLITVGVPSGMHRVELRFGETRLRWAADLVSLVSAGVFVVVSCAWMARRRAARPPDLRPAPPGRRGDALAAAGVGLAALCLFGLRVPWRDITTTVPRDGWDHRFANEHAPWAYAVPGGVQVGSARILGYRQPTRVAAGESVRVELALAAAAGGLSARLVAPAEWILNAPRGISSAAIEATGMTGVATLAVPSATPPGLYQVELSGPGDAGMRWLLAPLRVTAASAAGTAAPPAGELANFGGELVLERVELSTDAVASRPAFHLSWRAVGHPSTDWRVQARLVDEAGHTWAASDGRPDDGFYPTTLWEPGEQVAERRELTPLDGTPPGRYRLELRVYSLAGRSLDVLDARGAAIGPSFRSGPFDVPPGGAPSAPPADAPPVRLAEAVVGAKAADAGTTVPVSLLWQAGSRPPAGAQVELTLGGATVRWPLGGGYPAAAWRPGETVREIRDVATPKQLAAGDYPAVVRVVDPANGQGLLDPREIGRVTVRNRPRRFDLPPLDHPVGARFGDGIELAGWTADPAPLHPGGKLGLTLYWRALGDVAASYTVFTHLLDDSHRVRGQVDQIPGGGALPTNGWAVGEVVEDRYQIPLDAGAPPARYELEVGLYDARDGRRLPVSADGQSGDHLVLTVVDAVP